MSDHHHPGEPQQKLKSAEAQDLPVSTPAYNAALNAFATAKALEPGLEFLRIMKAKGRVPLDEQTHNTGIELCKECGETEMAVAMLEQMKADGVSAPTVVFGVAFRSFRHFHSSGRVGNLKGYM